VPVSRLIPGQNFSLGKTNEITRDELKFNKFVGRLRNKFGTFLVELLRVQLIAKNIVSADDWKEVEKNISIDFENDNNFVEMRDSELWQNRFAMLQQVAPFVGQYFSPEWVKEHILKLTEEEIKEMDKEMENMDDKYLPPEQQQMMQQQQMDQQQQEEATPDNPQAPPIDGNVDTGPTRPPIKENIQTALDTEKSLAELQLLETVTNYLKK
jgi:hypothetical protein